MNTFQKIKLYITTHTLGTIVVVLIIGIGVVVGIKRTNAAKTQASTYSIGVVQKGTIVSTVTGSGQVSTSQTVALKPKVSSTLLSIKATAGTKIKKGQLLFVMDSSDAQRSLKSAQDNLKSAQLDLASFKAQNTTSIADQNKTVKNAYTTLLSSNLEPQAADLTTSGYQAPTISGNYTLEEEGSITLQTYSSQGGISFQTSGLVAAYGLVSNVSPQPLGTSGLYVLFPSNIKGGLTWTIDIPNKSSANYISNKNAYDTAVENQTQINDPLGTQAVSLATKELAVSQAQDNVDNAKETVSDYYVTAPFDGVLASVPVNNGDDVSSATTLGTVITNNQVATISLNEVDVSKVATGDKVTLTFDAITGLTLTGTVSSVDALGTVTSGVVNYAVTITFDTQDARVKSGMSVTAAIQTSVAQDVLTVPSSAVKTNGDESYVLTVPSNVATTTTPIALAEAPTQTPVTVGITDGVTTEIKSGLAEGDKIVTKTTTVSTKTTTTTSAPSLLGGGTSRTAGGARATTGGFGR